MASVRPPHEARPAKRIDLSPSLWIGVGFYLLFGRMGIDFLITGNRHLGPIELGDADTLRPHGGSSYLAGGFYALFFGAATVGVIIYTGFWRQWLFWKGVPARSGLEAVLATLFAFVALTELFAAPTTLLLAHHSLGATHPVIPLHHLYAKTEEQYAWHFADAIPALDIPDTLKWSVPYEFKNAAGGALVLVYKILVIVPVVNLAVDLMKRTRQSRSAEETSVQDTPR